MTPDLALAELSLLAADKTIGEEDLRARAGALMAAEVIIALSAIDPVELHAPLERLRQRPGCAGVVDRIAKAIRSERRRAQQQNRPPSDDIESLSEWLDGLGCPWTPVTEQAVPSGWIVHHSGQIRRMRGGEEQVICPAPITVIGRGRTEAGEIALDLAWQYEGQWIQRTVLRGTALRRDRLLALADLGIPADHATATAVCQWLTAVDAGLAARSREALGRQGWSADGRAYMWGDEAIGGDLSLIAPGAGEAQRAAAVVSEGTWAGWVEGVWGRTNGQVAQAVVLAALAAPLLRIVGAEGFTVDVGGEQGSGKSTAQRAAASVWGPPRLLDWPRTWAGCRSLVEWYADQPTILDDTKNVRDPDHITSIVYLVAGETSQVLGAAGGGTRADRLVRTIVISSGESPIGESLRDAQGGARRIITIAERPWPMGSREQVQALDREARQHHGLAGPRLIEWLIEHRDRWDQIRRDYWWRVEEIAARGQTDDAGRYALRLALLYLAADLVREALEIEPSYSVLDRLIETVLAPETRQDAPRRALEAVGAWLASRSHQVEGWAKAPETPFLATYDDYHRELSIVSAELDRELVRLGYVPAEIRRQWVDRGWVTPGARGEQTVRRTLSGHRVRLLALSPEGLVIAEGGDD